jgi:hypothetical protein
MGITFAKHPQYDDWTCNEDASLTITRDESGAAGRDSCGAEHFEGTGRRPVRGAMKARRTTAKAATRALAVLDAYFRTADVEQFATAATHLDALARLLAEADKFISSDRLPTSS